MKKEVMDILPGLVSVVIPSYGCAGSIGAVLEGVFSQDYPLIEVIVVNDASPDKLEEALQPFLSRIKYMVNDTNLGLSKTYNVGIRVARGSYIMTLHSDCVLESNYIARLVLDMEEDSSIAVMTGQYRFDNMSGMRLSDKIFAAVNLLPVNIGSSVSTRLEDITFFEGKADLFRRSVFSSYGLFNERLSLTAEDQDLSARIREDGFRICQDNSVRFGVFFSATQDTLGKVLMKQRTYARGQAFVLMQHGRRIVARTTQNRNMRALHRFGQLAYVSTVFCIVGLGCVRPIVLLVIALMVLGRGMYYVFLGKWLLPSERIWAAIIGSLGDFYYFFGFLQGCIQRVLLNRG